MDSRLAPARVIWPMDFHPNWITKVMSRTRRKRRATRRGKMIVSKASWATNRITTIPNMTASILIVSDLLVDLHVLFDHNTFGPQLANRCGEKRCWKQRTGAKGREKIPPLEHDGSSLRAF